MANKGSRRTCFRIENEIANQVDKNYSIEVIGDYHDLFARTVPAEDYDNAEASLKVYALAQEDALKTFKSLDSPEEFIQLIYDQTKAAWDDGYGDKQLTALVRHMAGG